MPIYEYECEKCSHRFEKIQKFSDPLADTCPKCGSAVHKLQSAPAFQFKGTGWYVTDYGKGGTPDAGKPDAKDTKKTADAAKPDGASSTSSSTSDSSSSGASSGSSSAPASSSTSAGTDGKKSGD
jgi:putative FmdB family regulatory protein